MIIAKEGVDREFFWSSDDHFGIAASASSRKLGGS